MKWVRILGVLGLVVLTAGHFHGLFLAPTEATMGETGRILYAHVPCAWVGMLSFLVAFVAAIGVMWSGRRGWDALVEAGVEVGVLFSVLLLVQGSLWAHRTWDTWWTWDPRLTTTAIMLVAFVGVLVLRRLIEQPERRMTASAVATIISFVDVPVVYFSVRRWKTLHQPLSERGSIDASMLVPLMTTFAGMLLVGTAFIVWRWRLAMARAQGEEAPHDLPERVPMLEIPAEKER